MCVHSSQNVKIKTSSKEWFLLYLLSKILFSCGLSSCSKSVSGFFRTLRNPEDLLVEDQEAARQKRKRIADKGEQPQINEKYVYLKYLYILFYICFDIFLNCFFRLLMLKGSWSWPRSGKTFIKEEKKKQRKRRNCYEWPKRYRF